MSQTIVLADDHKIVRDGLRGLLEKEPDLKVVAEAEDGRKAVELVHEHHPNMVIMDVGMPNLNGIEATRHIVSHAPNTKVIALSMHSRAQFVGRMLEAGAKGYLLKDCAYEELVAAVRTVLARRVYLSKGITGVVVDDYVRHRSEKNLSILATLTPREREILQLMAEGGSSRGIAHELHVSVKTVETHRMHIMEKLNTRSIAGLTKYAISEGLTSLDD